VAKWIVNMWAKDRPKGCKLEFEELDVHVDWSGVSITHDDVQYADQPHAPKPKSSVQTVYRTNFTNNTDAEQEYSFMTERATRQVCTLTFTNGFALKNQGFTIKFTMPKDILSLGGGVKREHSVEYGYDETKEQEVTWSVDSRIRVGPMSRTLASVDIKEIEHEKDFMVLARVRGTLMIILYNKTNGELYKFLTRNITDVIHDCWLNEWFPSSNPIFQFVIKEEEPPYARCFLAGKCKFRLGVEQHVNLEEELITEKQHSHVKDKIQAFPRKDANNMPILRGR
jgi:hypothetical protein